VTIANCWIPDGVEVRADVIGPSQNRRPDKAITYLLRRAGVPTERIDTPGSFAAAAAEYDARGYVLDGATMEDWTFKQYFLELAFESRSIADWPFDKAVLRFLSADTTADVTLSRSEILRDSDNSPMVTIERGSAKDIVNVINLRYDRRAYLGRGDTGAYRELYPIKDQPQYDLYGALEQPDLFLFDFVKDDAMAEDVGDFYLEEKKSATEEVTVHLHLGNLAIEKDDVLAFSLPEP
jgi:hypothetical protein